MGARSLTTIISFVSYSILSSCCLSSVFGAMIFAGFSLGQSAAFAPDIPKAAGAASRIFKLLDLTPSIDSYSDEGEELVSDCCHSIAYS